VGQKGGEEGEKVGSGLAGEVMVKGEVEGEKRKRGLKGEGCGESGRDDTK